MIAESFERIHRSNLVGMGILPLQFKDGVTRHDLALDGHELFDITGVEAGLEPRQDVDLTIMGADGGLRRLSLLCRIETLDEIESFRHGGILPYVLRTLATG